MLFRSDLTSTRAASTLQPTSYASRSLTSISTRPPPEDTKTQSELDEDAPCSTTDLYSCRHWHIVTTLCITYRYRKGARAARTMLPQNAYDSGLRGIRLFDSSGPDGRHLHTQDIQYLAPDGIHLRDGRASGTARPLAPPQYAHPVRTNSQPLIKQEDYNSSGIYATQAANAEQIGRASCRERVF